MAHVNLLKQIKIDDRWVLRSIPKKSNGQRDWGALPDGSYFIEWREKGKRRRLPAGATVAQALEVQRRKHAELEALAFGIIVLRIPAKANAIPEGSRTAFRDDPE